MDIAHQNVESSNVLNAQHKDGGDVVSIGTPEEYRMNDRTLLTCGNEECALFPTWCRHCRGDTEFDNFHVAPKYCVPPNAYFEEEQDGNERWMFVLRYEVTLNADIDSYYSNVQERNEEAVFNLEKAMIRNVLGRFQWDANCTDDSERDWGLDLLMDATQPLMSTNGASVIIQENRASQVERFLSGGSFDPPDNITDVSCSNRKYPYNSICIVVDGAFIVHINDTFIGGGGVGNQTYIETIVHPQIETFLKVGMAAGIYDEAHYDVLDVFYDNSTMHNYTSSGVETIPPEEEGGGRTIDGTSPDNGNGARKTPLIIGSIFGAAGVALVASAALYGMLRWKRHMQIRSLREQEFSDDALREDEDMEVA